MTVTFESFHIGGTKVGALVRKVSPGHLETLTCFDLPEDGGVVSLHHGFEYDQDPFEDQVQLPRRQQTDRAGRRPGATVRVFLL